MSEPAPRQSRRTLADYDKRLVVFDTNVVEARYLAPLLRGEECRDFALLRRTASPYQPALYVKSYYEICQHAKLGTKRFPWCSPEFSYPGGMPAGRAILRQLPAFANEPNLYWWFCMAEEWMACDWTEEEERVRFLLAPSAWESALREVKVRRQFTERKYLLAAFCERVWDALVAQMTILTPIDVYGFHGEYHQEALSLDHDLAIRRLVPNEDLEIVSAALSSRASAFVTAEKALLSSTALTIDLNWKTAFVHVDRLAEALSEEFTFRWSEPQTSARPPRARRDADG